MELRLVRHAVVDSTNERALAAVEDGSARHGDVHLAEGQSAGRGRRGHAWASATGEGLYLSLVLLPATPPRPVALTMGAGLAVLEAVHGLGASGARLKWPNDVLARNSDGAEAKLAGILVEARGLDPARPHAVVGIGLNVRQTEFTPALEAERAVTSLRRLGLEVALEEVLAALLARLGPRMERACSRPAEVARDFATALGLLGSLVRVRLAKTEARGRLITLDLSGVELESEAGTRSSHLLEHVQGLDSIG